MANVNSLETVIDRSRQELLAFMEVKEPTGEDFKRARTIQGIYASATRELQTRGAQEATRYAMAADVLTGDERADYIRLAMPEHAANKIRSGRARLEATNAAS